MIDVDCISFEWRRKMDEIKLHIYLSTLAKLFARPRFVLQDGLWHWKYDARDCDGAGFRPEVGGVPLPPVDVILEWIAWCDRRNLDENRKYKRN